MKSCLEWMRNRQLISLSLSRRVCFFALAGAFCSSFVSFPPPSISVSLSTFIGGFFTAYFCGLFPGRNERKKKTIFSPCFRVNLAQDVLNEVCEPVYIHVCVCVFVLFWSLKINWSIILQVFWFCSACCTKLKSDKWMLSWIYFWWRIIIINCLLHH